MTKSMFYGSKSLRLLAALLAAALFVLAACAQPNLPMLAQQAAAGSGDDGGSGGVGGGGPSLSEAVQLGDGWNNGNITPAGEHEWFKFTASAIDQYVHFKFGELEDINMNVYNSANPPAAKSTYLAMIYTRALPV